MKTSFHVLLLYDLKTENCYVFVYCRDVHIIELKPSKAGLSPKPLVTVNIGTAARLSVQVHLVLILQSQQTVRWHLSSQGIRGMVDIIVSR